jgi:TolB protein
MHRHPRRSATLLGVILLLTLATAITAQAPVAPPQAGRLPDEVTVLIEKGIAAQLHLAFPTFTARAGLSPAGRRAAEALEAALREDLARSGIFVLQGPRQLEALRLTGDQARDFELYRSLGNEVLLQGEVFEEGGRLVLEGRVFDLGSGHSILGKRYRGGFELARRMAHTFADEIVLYFTGRRGIALTSIAFYSDRNGNKEIWVMDYDGRNPRPLTAHESISMSPAWSPGGDALAYMSFVGGTPGIYVVELADGSKRPVITEGSLNSSPTFSPDGQRIAFTRSLEGNTEIFVVHRNGSGLRRLTHSPGIDTNPAWSPTGNQIAFTSRRTGTPNIYVMPADGGTPTRATYEGDYNDGAAWSPDGTRIAYASRRGGQFRIAVTDLATLETRVISRGPGSHESPAFSPDGRRIAYAVTEGRRTQIRVMDADGSNPEVLTSEGSSWAPSWSPYP